MRYPKRRRQEGKTDYNARLTLLKSGIPRIVFRKTNKYIIGQYITSEEARDKVEIGVGSKDLLEYGWPKEMGGSLKSMPAAYLTGYLLGKKIIANDGKQAILDIGLMRNIKKSRIFAFLKGAIDAGVKINANEKVFPDESRIRGRHLKRNADVDKIKEKIDNAK